MKLAAIFLFLGAAPALAGKTALILIDVQDCFLNASTTSGKPGSLSVPASHIIPLINSIRKEKGCLFDKVILTRDFHPVKHISFGSTHGLAPFSHLGGKGALPVKCLKPVSGKTVDAACCPKYHINKGDRTNCDKELCPPAGHAYDATGNKACTTCSSNPASCMDDKQAMWTDHCLQNGDSTFPPSLVQDAKDIIVKKGTNRYVDAYSGFMDNTQNLMTELDPMLQKEGIDTLYVAGIATDVCVAATVRDAFHSKTGQYTVKVVQDATAAVLGNKANYDKAIKDMMGFGATIVTTADVLKMACPKATCSNFECPSGMQAKKAAAMTQCPGDKSTCVQATCCEPKKAGKTALVLIDVQDCFLNASTTSGKPGSLSVPASHIIPLINSIRKEKGCLFDKVILTRDFHPVKHISFGSTHGLAPFSHLGGKGALPVKCLKPGSGKTVDAACCPTYHINKGDRTNCDKELCPPKGFAYDATGNKACTTCSSNPASCMDDKQAMWTDHCLQNGDSTFPPSLVQEAKDIIVKKGTNRYVDAYSGFMDNTQNLMTELDPMLQKEGIDTLYVAGIATDVCVAATVRDAFHSKTGKYTVKVIQDATAAVLGNKANYDKAIKDMMGFGATIVSTADVLKIACPKACFVWTQLGIEHVTKLKKLEEYGQPKVNKPVSSKVQKIFYTSNFMETALEGKLIKKVGCQEDGMITSRATFVQAWWVAFMAVCCAVMQ